MIINKKLVCYWFENGARVESRCAEIKDTPIKISWLYVEGGRVSSIAYFHKTKGGTHLFGDYLKGKCNSLSNLSYNR
jgi:hypothetical protein